MLITSTTRFYSYAINITLIQPQTFICIKTSASVIFLKNYYDLFNKCNVYT